MHVGLIPDGNRRWAKSNNLQYPDAYAISMMRIVEFIKFWYAKNFDYISIYLLSKENLLRDRNDLDSVVKAEIDFIKNMLPDACAQLNCKVLHAGNKKTLPSDMIDAIDYICQKTVNNTGKTLFLLIGYNPIDELNSAITNYGLPVELSKLWVPVQVDILIRTAGGVVPLSNFIPLQCGYSQIYIVDKLFNDVTKEDYTEIHNNSTATTLLHGL
jgi:undecaprenyl diphosphate synthase